MEGLQVQWQLYSYALGIGLLLMCRFEGGGGGGREALCMGSDMWYDELEI